MEYHKPQIRFYFYYKRKLVSRKPGMINKILVLTKVIENTNELTEIDEHIGNKIIKIQITDILRRKRNMGNRNC